MNRTCLALFALCASSTFAPAQTAFTFAPEPAPRLGALAPQATTLTFYSGQSWLGVGLADLTNSSAANLHANSVNGAEIVEVYPDSPAAAAGLQARDVITEYNGEAVISVRQLERLVNETPADRTVAVKLLRDGKPVDAKVHLEARARGNTTLRTLTMPRIERDHMPEPPAMPVMPAMAPPPPPPAPRIRFGDGWETSIVAASGTETLGLALETLSPQLGEYFGLKHGQSGLLVRSVVGKSAAEKAGINAGDVLLLWGDRSLASPSDLRQAERASAGSEATATLLRHGNTVTVKVQVPAQPEGWM